MAKRSRPPRKSQHGRDSSSKTDATTRSGMVALPFTAASSPGNPGIPRAGPKNGRTYEVSSRRH